MYNASQKWWQLSFNLQYAIHIDWVTSGQKVMGMKSIKKNQTHAAQEDSDRVYLNVFADWKFTHLHQAMAKVVGTPSWTLLMNLHVVHSNMVGATAHPFVREVPYKCDHHHCRPHPVHHPVHPTAVHLVVVDVVAVVAASIKMDYVTKWICRPKMLVNVLKDAISRK